MEPAVEIPSPTVAALDAARFASWYASFAAHTFETRLVRVPAAFVRYALSDGVVAGEMNAALPVRIERDAFDAAESAERFADANEEEATDEEARRAFADFELDVANAIEELKGEVAPKFAWSAPKDAVWVSAGNTMKCRNVDEVVMLLKSSDSVAHDLTEAYGACRDYSNQGEEGESEEERAIRQHGTTALALREWFDLNPSMEFRCFVKNKNLIGISQRHVNDFYDFLLRDKDSIEDAIAIFWEANISGSSWHSEQVDYVFDVYVTPKTKKVKIVDFNVWGGTTLPLLFEWHELEAMEAGSAAAEGDDARGYADNIEFRIIESQGHIRPGLQLGVPFDLYDTTQGGAIAEFLQEQRRQQDAQ